MTALLGLQCVTFVLAVWTSLVFGSQMALAGLLPAHGIVYVLILVSVWDSSRRGWATYHWLGGPGQCQ